MAKDEAKKLSGDALLNLALDEMQEKKLIDTTQRGQFMKMVKNGHAEKVVDLVSKDANQFVAVPGRYKTEFYNPVLGYLSSKRPKS